MPKLAQLLTALLPLTLLAACSTPDPETAAQEQAAPEKLTVAIVPYEDALKMAEGFQPIADHIAKKTGKEVEIINVTNYAVVIESLKSKTADIAWLGPLSYNLATQQTEVEPICIGDHVEKGNVYHSLLLVKADSPYQTLQDLKGKSAAFVDPNSTSGNLVPTTLVIKTTDQKPDEFFGQLVYAGSHDASLLQLNAGSVDVAAVQDITFEEFARNGKINRDDFRIISKSSPLPGSPLVMRSDLDPELKSTIRDALLNAHKEGVTLNVPGMGEFKSFVEAKDEDYAFIGEMVQALGLTPDQMLH